MRNSQKRIVFLGTIFMLLLLVMLVLFFARLGNLKNDFKGIKKTTAITFTSEDLSKLLQDTLKEPLPFQTLIADIGNDGMVHLAVDIKKEDLDTLLREHDLPFYHALPLFSDPIPAELDFRLNFNERQLIFSPLSFKIAGFDLTKFLSMKLVDAINRSINEQISKYNLDLSSIQSLPEGFTIQFKR